MKGISYLFLFLVFWNQLLSQAPVIHWQKCYGGSKADHLLTYARYTASMNLLTRNKKNIIIAGSTNSVDGDMGAGDLMGDMWIAYLDLSGNELWHLRIDDG